MDQLANILIALLVFIGIGSIETIKQQRTDAYNQYETQQVCDRSRTVNNGELENTCGELQEAYGVEYLCNSYAPDAICWTEVK